MLPLGGLFCGSAFFDRDSAQIAQPELTACRRNIPPLCIPHHDRHTGAIQHFTEKSEAAVAGSIKRDAIDRIPAHKIHTRPSLVHETGKPFRISKRVVDAGEDQIDKGDDPVVPFRP